MYYHKAHLQITKIGNKKHFSKYELFFLTSYDILFLRHNQILGKRKAEFLFR